MNRSTHFRNRVLELKDKMSMFCCDVHFVLVYCFQNNQNQAIFNLTLKLIYVIYLFAHYVGGGGVS